MPVGRPSPKLVLLTEVVFITPEVIDLWEALVRAAQPVNGESGGCFFNLHHMF